MRAKNLRSSGFTMVELMVTVAIIGILSSIATPLFKQYKVKALSVEGKLAASTMQKGQTAWYAEFGVYGQCLPEMGIMPLVGAKSRFNWGFTGFSAISTPNGAPSSCGNAAQNIPAGETYKYYYQSKVNPIELAGAEGAIDSFGVNILNATDQQSYEFIAVADFSQYYSGVWKNNVGTGLMPTAYALVTNQAGGEGGYNTVGDYDNSSPLMGGEGFQGICSHSGGCELKSIKSASQTVYTPGAEAASVGGESGEGGETTQTRGF